MKQQSKCNSRDVVPGKQESGENQEVSTVKFTKQPKVSLLISLPKDDSPMILQKTFYSTLFHLHKILKQNITKQDNAKMKGYCKNLGITKYGQSHGLVPIEPQAETSLSSQEFISEG